MSLKKILALVLVFAMCLSFVPTYAFAEDDGIELVEEVEDIVEVVDEPEEEPAAEPVEEETPAEPVEEEVPAEEPAPVEEEPAAEPEEEEEEEEVLVEGAIEDTETFDRLDGSEIFVVDSTKYDTLAAAAVAATDTDCESKTVQVKKDYATNTDTFEEVSSNGTYSIVGTGSPALGPVEFTNGTVSISGVNFAKGVTINGATANVTIDGATIEGAITVSSGTLTLNNVTANLSQSCVTVANGATLTIVATAEGTGYPGYYKSEIVAGETANVTITGGKFEKKPADNLLGAWCAYNTSTKMVENNADKVAYITEAGETEKYYYTKLSTAVSEAEPTDTITLNPNLGNFAVNLTAGKTVKIATNGNLWDEENSRVPDGYLFKVTTDTSIWEFKAVRGAAYIEGGETYETFPQAAAVATQSNASVVVLMAVPTAKYNLATDASLTVKSVNSTVRDTTATDLFNATDDFDPANDNNHAKPYYVTTATNAGAVTYTLTSKPYAVGTDTAPATYYLTFKAAVTGLNAGSSYLYALAGSEAQTVTSTDLPATGNNAIGQAAYKLQVISEDTSFSITNSKETTKSALYFVTTPTNVGSVPVTTYSFNNGAAVVTNGTTFTAYPTLAEAAEAVVDGETIQLATKSNLYTNDKITLVEDTEYRIAFVADDDTIGNEPKVPTETALRRLATDTELSILVTTETNLFGGVIKGVAPAAKIAKVGGGYEYYATLAAAVGAAYSAGSTGTTTPTIIALKDSEWTLSTNSNLSTGTDASFRIAKNSTGTVTVKAPAGYVKKSDDFDFQDSSKNYTAYWLVKTVATVNDEPYATLAEAIEAADGTDYPVMLLETTTTNIVLNYTPKSGTTPEEYQTLTIGPKKFVYDSTHSTYWVTTPSNVDGHNFYMVVTPENASDNDAVTFELKELVASVEYTKNNYTRTEQFDSFADAADFIFEGGTAKTIKTGAVTTQSSITLYKAPAEDDTWTLTEGYLKVASGTNYVGTKGFATDTALAVKGVDVRVSPAVTGNPDEVTFTLGSAVATVTLGNGDVKYFDSVSEAIEFVQGKDANVRDNFCVTVVKDTTEALDVTTPGNVGKVATGTDKAFKMVYADGVKATLTAPADAEKKAADASSKDLNATSINNDYALMPLGNDKWVVKDAAAAVNMGELQTTTSAEFVESTNYKTNDWTYYPTVEDAIEAANNGERLVVAFKPTTSAYMLNKDEVLKVYSQNDTATFTVLGVQDVNNANYVKGYKTIRTTATTLDQSPFATVADGIATFASGQTWTVKWDKNGATSEAIADSYVFDGDKVTLPTAPTRDGYQLDGWYDDDGNKLTAETKITKNTTFTAKWTSNTEYTYTFYWATTPTQFTNPASPTNLTTQTKIVAKAGTDISARLTAMGDLITDIDGYDMLDGWYEATGTNLYQYSTDTVVVPTVMTASNTSFYKQYVPSSVTATFVYTAPNGEMGDLGEIKVPRGTKFDAATFTDLQGKINQSRYKFKNWQVTTATGLATGDAAAMALIAVDKNLTFTAVLEDVKPEVKWIATASDIASNTEFVLATATVFYGDAITAPTYAQVKAMEDAGDFSLTAGYTYDPDDMWRMLDGKAAVPTTVTTDTNIYLKVVEGYSVGLKSDGKVVATAVVAPGTTIKQNMDEFKAKLADAIDKNIALGYKMVGFVDMDEDFEIDAPCTLTVEWAAAPTEVTAYWYDEDGVTLLATTTSVFGEEIVLPDEDPVKEGTNLKSYTFEAWKDENNVEWALTGTGKDAKFAKVGSSPAEYYPIMTEDVSFKATYAESDISFNNVSFTYALSLSDKISLAFYVKDLPTNTDLDGYEVSWSMLGKTGTATLSSHNKNEIKLLDLAAKEVAEEATITVTYKGQMITSEPKVLSVKKYCDNIIGSRTDKLRDLCKALLEYGYAAQQIFSYEGTPALATAPTYQAIPATGFTTKAIKQGSVEGITGVSANVSLEARIEFFVTLKHESGAKLEDYTITALTKGEIIPSDRVDISDTGSGFLVKIKGIAAKDLGEDVVVSAKKGSSVYSVTMSPFTYCYSKSNNANATDNAKNLAKALYAYGDAAAAYYATLTN